MELLAHLAKLSPERAALAAKPLLERLAAVPGVVDGAVPGLVDQLPSSGTVRRGPWLTTLSTEHDLTLQLFVWPSHIWTPIHDHTSWGVYLCLGGALLEDRYVRLDDESVPADGNEWSVAGRALHALPEAHVARAHLRREWRALWRPGDASSLMPYAGGIHRVGNPSEHPAVSLHLYGPPMAAIDGRDYDPLRDLVCDRPVVPERPRRLTSLAA